MEPEQLEHFRRLLEGLCVELETRIGVERHRVQNVPEDFGTVGDEGDDSLRATTTDVRMGTGQRLTEELRSAISALQRLQEGTYGFCDECGDPIPERRLEAIPWATTCTRCASLAETDVPERGGL